MPLFVFIFLGYNPDSKRKFSFEDIKRDGCELQTGIHEFSEGKQLGAKLFVPQEICKRGSKECNPYLDFTPLARALRQVLEEYLFVEIEGVEEMPFEGDFTIRPEFAVDIPVQHLHKDRADQEILSDIIIGFYTNLL